MKMTACLVCLTLIFVSIPSAICQDRGGSMRVRVRDERGKPQVDETLVYTDSYALLIGNAAYNDPAWTDLPDAAEDIAAVREVLEKQHGFKVEVAINQKREALLRAIDQFISRHGQRYTNRLLIYYSGHGYTALSPDDRRMGYLVMPDAPPMPDDEKALRISPSDEEFEHFLPAAITMDEIETFARRIAVRHALFVFDSCFSGTVLYRDLGAGIPDEITTEELKSVRAYLSAGDETQRVPAFSKFRRKFVAGLMGEADTNGDGYILSSELGRWVSLEVEKDTARQQTPRFGKSDLFKRGDMLFVSPKAGASVSAWADDRKLWERVKASRDAEDFKYYLGKCRSGEIPCAERVQAEYELSRLTRLAVAAPVALIKTDEFKRLAKSLTRFDWVGPYKGEWAEVHVAEGDSGRIKVSFIDRAGKLVLPFKYNGIGEFKDGLAHVLIGSHVRGKIGYIDKTGREVVPVKYDISYGFVEGLAAVGVGELLTAKYGFVDRSGREVIPTKYENASSFKEGLAAMQSDGKWGLIDKSGAVIVPFKYDSEPRRAGGLFRVKLNGKQGLIDRRGTEIVPIRYDEVADFSEGLAAVRVGSEGNARYGFVNEDGAEIIPLKYQDARSFYGELAWVKSNGRYGLINRAEKEVLPFRYDAVIAAGGGLYGVKVNNKWGFIDKTGREVTPFKYDEVEEFNDEGLAEVTADGKDGLVNRRGVEVTPLKYGFILNFSEGLAPVGLNPDTENEKCGYVNRSGEEVVPLKYDICGSFRNGLATVTVNRKYGLIDNKGRELTPIKYENGSAFSEIGFAMVMANGKVGQIDRTGKEVLPLIYDGSWCYVFYDQGVFGVYLNGRKGFVDIHGNSYFDFK